MIIKALGKEYRIDKTFNALCEIEEVLGEKVVSQLTTGGLSGFTVIRSVLNVMLKRYHPELTLEETGDIISDLGLEKGASVITEALTAILTGGKSEETEGKQPMKREKEKAS